VGKPSLNAAQPYAKAEGRVFLLVPAYLGCPGTKAVKRLLLLLDAVYLLHVAWWASLCLLIMDKKFSCHWRLCTPMCCWAALWSPERSYWQHISLISWLTYHFPVLHPQWGGSLRANGFIFGMGKLEWLQSGEGRMISTQSFDTHSDVAIANAALTHCIRLQKLNVYTVVHGTVYARDISRYGVGLLA